MANQIGIVCDEWDYRAKRCASQIPVFQSPGSTACYFTTKMAIDADGAPKAYYPGEYFPSNTHGAFDWLDNLNPADRHGVQGQDARGPAAGFLVSGTALVDDRHGSNDTRKYVDASSIPYVVLTGASAFPNPAGMLLQKGCIVFVTDTSTGIYSGAIYADVGRAVGEGSIALALMLGIDPFDRRRWPKVTGGVSDKRIFHLVFPHEIVAPPWPVDEIQRRALALFQRWGGEVALKDIFPRMPTMSGPRPVVIEPSAQVADSRRGDVEQELDAREFKGADVPKADLDR